MSSWNYFYTEDEEKVIEDNWVAPYEWIYLPDGEKEEMVDAWYFDNEEKLKELSDKARQLFADAVGEGDWSNDIEPEWEKIHEVLEEWQYKKRKTLAVGMRLESAFSYTAQRLKEEEEIQDYEHIENDVEKPDFVVDGDIAVECKNKDPEKKSAYTPQGIDDEILKRYHGSPNWVKKKTGSKNWRKKVLVIPELQYKSKPGKCEEKLSDVIVIEHFPWVSPDPTTAQQATDTIYKGFKKEVL